MTIAEEEAVSLEETVRVLEQGRVTAGEDNQRVFSVNDRTFTEIAVLGKSKNNKTYLVQGASGKAVVKALNDRLTIIDAQERSKAIELFEREAAVLARLNHPQIPKLYHIFQTEVFGEVGFYLMQEYFAGRNLEEVIKQRGKLPAQEAVSILLSLLDPVEYLHSQEPGPVVHRDIKPANILWDGVEAKLVDLGSVLDKKNDPMSGGSTIAGTRGYMAPEQWLGKTSPQSDIYSLGAALLQMITGVEPETLHEAEATSFEQKFTLGYKKQLGAALDQNLQSILDKCLDFNVQNRYSSVADLRNDLQQYLETPAIVKVENTAPATTSSSGISEGLIPLAFIATLGGLAYGGYSCVSSHAKELYRREHVHTLDTEEVAVLVDDNGYVKADEHPKGVETEHKAETVYEYPTPGMIVLSREIILQEQNEDVTYAVQGVLRYTIADPVATHLSSEAWRKSHEISGEYGPRDTCTKGNDCLKKSLAHFLGETTPKTFTSPEQLRTKYATVDNSGTKEGTPAQFVKTEFERYFPNGLQFQSFEYSVGMPIKQKK